MTSEEIKKVEQKLREELENMVNDGRLKGLLQILEEGFGKTSPSEGSYQLLFKTHARGFENDNDIPFHVNLLGVLGTGTQNPARTSECQESKTVVSFGPIDMEKDPCTHCKGSGFALK